MKKVYTIRLTPEERRQLHGNVHKGRVAAQKRRRSQILLLVDQGEYGPAMKDAQTAAQVGVTRKTVENVRKQCILQGLEMVLERRPRSRDRSRALDGDGEAALVAIASNEPPEGHSRWSLHRLVGELKRRGIVQSISHETVRKILKRNSVKL